MRLKMPELSIDLLIVALLIGLVIGYGMNNLFTAPEIRSLKEDVENKDNQIIVLQTAIDQLEENVTSLSSRLTDQKNLYDDLEKNSVSKIHFEALEDEYKKLSENYQTLEAQISSLRSINEDLTEENQKLSEEYEKLIAKYSKIRVLAWTYFETDNLRVNLSTTKTTYDQNQPIIGTISIIHEDNQPFNGTVKLILWSDSYSTGSVSDVFSVYGLTDYSFSYPFIQGPGTYYLRVSEIRNVVGDSVVTYAEAKEYNIKITMG